MITREEKLRKAKNEKLREADDEHKRYMAFLMQELDCSREALARILTGTAPKKLAALRAKYASVTACT